MAVDWESIRISGAGVTDDLCVLSEEAQPMTYSAWMSPRIGPHQAACKWHSWQSVSVTKQCSAWQNIHRRCTEPSALSFQHEKFPVMATWHKKARRKKRVRDSLQEDSDTADINYSVFGQSMGLCFTGHNELKHLSSPSPDWSFWVARSDSPLRLAGINFLTYRCRPSLCSSQGIRLSCTHDMRTHTPESGPSASSLQGASQVPGTLSPQLCHNSTACWDQPRRANCWSPCPLIPVQRFIINLCFEQIRSRLKIHSFAF